MTNRTRIARIAATTAVLLAAHALAQAQGLTKEPPIKPTGPLLLKMGGQEGVLLGFDAKAGGLVPGGKDPLKGSPLPTKGGGELAALLFTASTGAPQPFYAWVSGAFSGKPTPGAGQVVMLSGASVSRIEGFADAVVSEVDFPELVASSNKNAEFMVKATGRVSAEPVAKDAKALMPKVARTPWSVSGYRLSLGKVDGKGVVAIGAFTLKPNQPLKLGLRTRAPTTEALQQVLKLDPKLMTKAPGAKPIGLEGRLELIAADAHTVLATIDLHDARISEPGAGIAPKGADTVVNLDVTRAGITFAPLIAR